jgi:hypothetical protein
MRPQIQPPDARVPSLQPFFKFVDLQDSLLPQNRFVTAALDQAQHGITQFVDVVEELIGQPEAKLGVVRIPYFTSMWSASALAPVPPSSPFSIVPTGPGWPFVAAQVGRA